MAEKYNHNDLNEDDESESDERNSEDDDTEVHKPTDVQIDCDSLTLAQHELRDYVSKNRSEKEQHDNEVVSMDVVDYDELDDYMDENQFEIELGSSKLPRISCANHKLNLAVRKAMSEHQTICGDLKKLNAFLSCTRNSYNLIEFFKI